MTTWTPAKLIAATLFAVASLASTAHAQPGQLDASFGTGGRLTTSFSTQDRAAAVARQPDGKIVAAGRTISGGPTTSDFAIARYHDDGTLDPSFGAGGKVTTDFFGFADGATSVAIQSDGRIVVGGFASFVGVRDGGQPGPHLALARYEANGALDTTFGNTGKLVIDSAPYWILFNGEIIDVRIQVFGAAGVAIQSDGKILVGVAIFDLALGGYIAVARFDDRGSLDPDFSAPSPAYPSKATTGFALTEHHGGVTTFDIALQPDGRVVVAANWSTNTDQVVLARHLPSGAPDHSFGTAGKATYAPPSHAVIERGNDLALQPDGKIVVAGWMFRANFGSTYREAIVLKRYNGSGTLDSSFGNGGTTETWLPNAGMTAEAVTIDLEGNIVVAGCFEAGGNSFSNCGFDGPTTDFVLARFSPQGALELTFGGGRPAFDFFGERDSATAILMQPDGRLVVAGHASSNGGTQEDFGLIRVLGGTADCTATLSPTAATIGKNGGTGTVAVTIPPGCGWSTQSNSPWILFSGGTGSGNGVVTYHVFERNPSTSPRIGTLTIAGATFTLTQSPSAVPLIHTHPTSMTVSAGQSAQFIVSATSDEFIYHQWQFSNDGLAWANVPNVHPYVGASTPVLTITAPSTSHNGIRYRAVVTNTVGSATSNAATLTVTSSSCVYVVSVNEVTVHAGGASGGIDLTTGATCPWIASSAASWLIIAPSSGTGSARITFSVSAFSGSGQRTASLSLANQSVLFRQNGSGPSPPGQPTVTSAGVSGGVLTVTWSSGSGGPPTGHQLNFYVGPALVATIRTGPGTTFSVPLAPSVIGSFGVTVAASNALGSSPPSNEFNFTIGISPPGTPTVNSASATNGVLNIAWSLGTGAPPTSHRLDFFSGAALIATLSGGAATNVAISLPAGAQGTFGVAVTAFNGSTAGPTSGTHRFSIGPPCTIPGQPIVSGGIVGGVAAVTWPAVSGAASYFVSAGSAPGATDFLATTNVGVTTSLSVGGLPTGFQAWVRVAAVNACGQPGPSRDFLLH
jgi:uncharacterized delta-60 repeat protein